MSGNNDIVKKNEKTAFGIAGALLFALAGCALWIWFYCIDIFPVLCGIAIAVLAISGYKLFSKSKSKKSIAIPLIVSAVLVLVACYICLSIDIYCGYNGYFITGELDHTVSYGYALSQTYRFFLNGGIAFEFVIQSVLGMIFCMAGAVPFIVNAAMKNKHKKESAGEE